SRGAGLALRRLGLLRIPEERLPPDVLARAQAFQREFGATEPADAIVRLLGDDMLMAAHVAMLPPPRRRGDPIDVPLLVGLAKVAEADGIDAARAALSAAEKAAVLGSRDGIAALRQLAPRPATEHRIGERASAGTVNSRP